MAEKRMVFAIGRRCGSGGREVGKKLADHYGIKFYDKEIVTMLAERMNMPEDEVAKLEEKVTGHFSTKSGFAAAKDTLMGKMTKSDRMYLTEYALIANLAATENCVIVGRSGNAILADNPNTLHLHIFADDDFCFFILIHAVIPAEKTADFDGMVEGEVFVGFTTEAVGAEVFSHLRNSPFIWITSHRKTVGKGANQVLGRQVPTS